MQKFVEHILQLYKHQQVEQMGMDKDSKFIWLLEHPRIQGVHHLGERDASQILFIFISVNFISVYQSASS